MNPPGCELGGVENDRFRRLYPLADLVLAKEWGFFGTTLDQKIRLPLFGRLFAYNK
jgi:hypothetical protein